MYNNRFDDSCALDAMNTNMYNVNWHCVLCDYIANHEDGDQARVAVLRESVTCGKMPLVHLNFSTNARS